MTPAKQTPHKRRRSAIACISCHDRKVRCNAAFQGIPCSNCQQDNLTCEVYGRKPAVVSSRRPLRPRIREDGTESVNLLTPSTQALSDDAAASIRSPDGPSPLHPDGHTPQLADPAVAAHERVEDSDFRLDPANENIVPYFASESEGLEFLFDICAPDRALKGTHYIVNKQVHRREHLREKSPRQPTPFPDEELRQELLKCYFHGVHSFLPLVDIHSFFHNYSQGLDHVSHLLLWSMFFAAANFINADHLRRNRFASRKSFKEYCYQSAREIYDSQEEPDKIASIQSAVLLAMWYVDLEDRDGTWHWLGIAISLCHTIGLHRASNYHHVPRSPFHASQLAIWKRIWWCCYYREAFAAMGLGRPMRINIDDCDLAVPTVEEFLGDSQPLHTSTLEAFCLPSDRQRLATLWIHLLHLAMHVERVLAIHYRPRRPALSLSQLESQYSDIWKLRETAPTATDLLPTTSLLHAHHLQCYFSTVIIALYRPYILDAPANLAPAEQGHLRSLAQRRAKDAAADTTTAINKLVALDLIEFSGHMLVTTIMFAAQIHLYEIRHSEGLARQYASHHFNLHILVLSQLRRTYWTADHQHKLFTETLKAVENGELNGPQDGMAAKSPTASTSASGAGPSRHDPGYTNEADLEFSSATGHALEDLFLSFNPNPFMGVPPDFDPGTPGGWVLGNGTPLNLEPP